MVRKIHLTVTNKRAKSISIKNYDFTPSDYTFWFVVKPCDSTSTDDSDAVIKYEDDYTISSDGDLIITIMKSETDITPNTYEYELNIENVGTGNIIKLCSGNYIVETDIQQVF